MDKNKLKLIRVYSSSNASEAHMIRNFLEAEGIDARVSGDSLAHAGLAGVANVDVYTFEDDAIRAQELLADRSP